MNHYDHIYLSPHLDDAALSCGGQIHNHTAAGQSVLIVTITAVDAPPEGLSQTAAELHARWSRSADDDTPADTDAAAAMVALRRAEDEESARILGADILHWPFYDCIYRRHPQTGAALYDSTPALFGPVDPSEAWLVDELARQMAALPPAGHVYAPLGVGNHVDHQITRAAAERAFGADLLYYEDYPYVAIPGKLEAALPEANRTGWEPRLARLGEAALLAKIDSIRAFRSQLSTFFVDDADLEQKIRAEGRRVLVGAGHPADGERPAAERLWRRVSR